MDHIPLTGEIVVEGCGPWCSYTSLQLHNQFREGARLKLKVKALWMCQSHEAQWDLRSIIIRLHEENAAPQYAEISAKVWNKHFAYLHGARLYAQGERETTQLCANVATVQKFADNTSLRQAMIELPEEAFMSLMRAVARAYVLEGFSQKQLIPYLQAFFEELRGIPLPLNIQLAAVQEDTIVYLTKKRGLVEQLVRVFARPDWRDLLSQYTEEARDFVRVLARYGANEYGIIIDDYIALKKALEREASWGLHQETIV